MMFFKSRNAAREFARKVGRNVIDRGAEFVARRWAVAVI